MKENQIVDIDGYVHVVNGRVICFEPDVLDMNNPNDVDHVVNLASEMFVSKALSTMYGVDTFAILQNHPTESYKILSLENMQNFPDDLLRKVKGVVADYEEFKNRARN